MKVLIVGGGGREHALAWKCAQSARVRQVFVAPGNAGTALEPKVSNVRISADDLDGLLDYAVREDIELTIVGPEGPLVAGIVDRFTAAGRACFGPSRAAARLEGSKAFSKDFLRRHHPHGELCHIHRRQFRSGLHTIATAAAGGESGWPGRGQGRVDLRDT
jgi:phosphoribosylamine--glycine ligase